MFLRDHCSFGLANILILNKQTGVEQNRNAISEVTFRESTLEKCKAIYKDKKRTRSTKTISQCDEM